MRVPYYGYVYGNTTPYGRLLCFLYKKYSLCGVAPLWQQLQLQCCLNGRKLNGREAGIDRIDRRLQ